MVLFVNVKIVDRTVVVLVSLILVRVKGGQLSETKE